MIYSYCAHFGCKTFKFHVETGLANDVGIKVKVYSSAVDYSHAPGLKKTRYVKGIEYRQNCVAQASSEILKCGNYQLIKSEDTVRKIISEYLSRNDRHYDEISDMLAKREDSSYI